MTSVVWRCGSVDDREYIDQTETWTTLASTPAAGWGRDEAWRPTGATSTGPWRLPEPPTADQSPATDRRPSFWNNKSQTQNQHVTNRSQMTGSKHSPLSDLQLSVSLSCPQMEMGHLSWPMTHDTVDQWPTWPMTITSVHPILMELGRGVTWWYWTTLSVLRAKIVDYN